MADARIADSRASMGVLRDSVFDGCGDILDVLLAEMLSLFQAYQHDEEIPPHDNSVLLR